QRGRVEHAQIVGSEPGAAVIPCPVNDRTEIERFPPWSLRVASLRDPDVVRTKPAGTIRDDVETPAGMREADLGLVAGGVGWRPDVPRRPLRPCVRQHSESPRNSSADEECALHAGPAYPDPRMCRHRGLMKNGSYLPNRRGNIHACNRRGLERFLRFCRSFG